jgi:hypothetical protein
MASKVVSVNFGAGSTGLSTVGYTLYNASGSVKQSRTTTGVSELTAGSGIYSVSITFDYNWKGSIVWDTGEASPLYSVEDYNDEVELTGSGVSGTFSYNVNTAIGKVRLLIGDTVVSTALLVDEEISAILTLASNDTYAAAALCLMRIAANKGLLAKKKSAGNYSEDLTYIAKEMRESAKMYQEMSNGVPAEAQAEVILTDFNYREIVVNKSLRGEDD